MAKTEHSGRRRKEESSYLQKKIM